MGGVRLGTSKVLRFLGSLSYGFRLLAEKKPTALSLLFQVWALIFFFLIPSCSSLHPTTSFHPLYASPG